MASRLDYPRAERIADQHQRWLQRHGKADLWREVIEALPKTPVGWRMQSGRLIAGGPVADSNRLTEQLKTLLPWRKGPLTLGGVAIDTEWRSDWKWSRISPHVNLRNEQVLDVGAGNGCFGWAMLDAGAASVIGCDPTQLFIHQHEAISHFTGPAPNLLLATTLEKLDPALRDFGIVCSFGVLYHRRDPFDHLHRLAERMVPGGLLVLETLILPGPEDAQLDAPPRYANMRNVHALPTQRRLLGWVEQAGFERIRCVDVTTTTIQEQQRTEWMPFHSLEQALNPDDPGHTIEGLPAPLRAVVLARRPDT